MEARWWDQSLLGRRTWSETVTVRDGASRRPQDAERGVLAERWGWGTVAEMRNSVKRRGAARRRRGFTLTEIVIVIMVIGILGTIAVPSYQAVRRGTERNSHTMTLLGYTSKARQIAAREGNQYQYPADLIAELVAIDAKVSDGVSPNENVISGWRESTDAVVFARRGNDGRCYIVRDDIASDAQTYAFDPDPSACEAARTNGLAITGSRENPNSIELPE